MLRYELNMRIRLLLLLIPAGLLAVAFLFKTAAGPFWFYYNIDPNYFYLFNSTTLAEGNAPDCVLHPGTPVQIIGAVVMRVLHLFSGSGSLRDDMLARPEFFLNALNLALLLPFIVFTFLAGRAVYRYSGSLSLAVLIQVSPLFSYTLLDALTTFKPEPMLMWAGLWLGTVMLRDVADAGAQEIVNKPFSLKNRSTLYGIIIGFGLAIKFTFLPFIILPLLLLPGMGAWINYSLATACSLAFFTLPAITRWKWFYKNFVDIATHTGAYGSGSKGLMDWERLPGQVKQLLLEEPHWAAILALSILVCLAGLLFRRHDGPVISRAVRFLAALTAVEILHVLMTCKQPSARYLLPSYAMAGTNLALIFWILHGSMITAQPSEGTSEQPKPTSGQPMLAHAFLFLLLPGLLGSGYLWNSLRAQRLVETQAKLEFYQAIEPEVKRSGVIYGHVASAPDNALHCGNMLYSRYRYEKELAAKFPNTIFYDTPRHTWVHVNRPITEAQLAGFCESFRLTMLGHQEWVKQNTPPGFEARLIRAQGEEGLFEMVKK